MLSKSQDQGPQAVKTTRMVDSKSRRRRRETELVDDGQTAEMRGRRKGATANIATGIVTEAEAAVGKDTGSTGGGTETTVVSRPHAVSAGLTGAGAAVGTTSIADDTGTTGPRGAEAAAGNIGGQREMNVVKGLQTDEVSALGVGGVIDKHITHSTPTGCRRLAEFMLMGRLVYIGLHESLVKRLLWSWPDGFEGEETRTTESCTCEVSRVLLPHNNGVQLRPISPEPLVNIPSNPTPLEDVRRLG